MCSHKKALNIWNMRDCSATAAKKCKNVKTALPKSECRHNTSLIQAVRHTLSGICSFTTRTTSQLSALLGYHKIFKLVTKKLILSLLVFIPSNHTMAQI